MNEHTTDLRIDAGRFRATFEELAAIGATPKGGVDRPAFSITAQCCTHELA